MRGPMRNGFRRRDDFRAPTLTSASAPFKVPDLGKAIIVGGTGASGGLLQSTIANYISPSQFSLTARRHYHPPPAC